MSEWQINDYIPDPNTGKDRWQIYKIFKGGMGVVYIVYDIEWREAFAVKTYQDKLQSERAEELFKKEALIWINLDRHENVAWARMVQNISNRLYLFLEYVPGGDLSRWIGTKRLDLKQTLLFAIQFCYGMEHALEKGVKAHRDIKPQNCLITEDDTLKITDFGLAKTLHISDIDESLNQSGDASVIKTRNGQIGGTLPYMAPEQFEALKSVDVKADIYSFGIMLYEMVSGHHPFTGNSFTEFRDKHQKAPIPELPSLLSSQAAPLTEIVKNCLAKKTWNRYSNFDQVRNDLSALYKTIYFEEPPLPKMLTELTVFDLNNKGRSLRELGRFEEAISCYDQALDINPQDVFLLYNKGIALRKNGKIEKAIIYYDEALKLNPNHLKSWNNKGIAFEILGHYEKAIECYDNALKIDCKDAAAWSNKGNSLRKLKKYREAISCYNNALEIEPEDAEFWSNKGVALSDLKDYEEAMKCYNRSIEIDPEIAQTWSNIGNMMGEIGRYKDAITCYSYSLKIDPKNSLVWHDKGEYHRRIGEFEKALYCFDRALDIEESPLHWSSRGTALSKLERYEEAIFCYDRAIEIDPYCAEAWSNKSGTLIDMGNFVDTKFYKEALNCCNQALEINPNLAKAWYNKGSALANLEQFHDALLYMQKAKDMGDRQAEQALLFIQNKLRIQDK